MDIEITPHRLSGRITAPPSKSFAHRALICAALADNESVLAIPSVSEDIEASARCLRALGATLDYRDGAYYIMPVKNPPPTAILDCGESGSTLRFMMPLAASLGVSAEFVCHGRLGERPISELRSQLEAHGISFDGDHKISGRLTAGEFQLPGNVSSQYVTGLLLALSLLDSKSKIVMTSPLMSKPYVDITISTLAEYNSTVAENNGSYTVTPCKRFHAPDSSSVEGDWSNASFWLASGVSVGGLNPSSVQGDRAILSVMENFGATLTVRDGTVSADISTLSAQTVDAENIPDIVPPIAVLCAIAEGESRITGASRLRIKESDRIKTVCATLLSLGALAVETADGLIIKGNKKLRGGVCDSFSDHRIAMAAAIASQFCSDTVTVKNAEAVNKSYPGFWSDFRSLGGEFTVVGGKD